jgi:hypothetical protein
MRQAITTLLLALFLLACGASARERTIAAAFTTTNASRDAFIAFDARHQAEIVKSATSLDDGKAKLANYRAQREPIVQAFAAVYRVIAAAAIAKDATSVADMINAAKLLAAALHELTGGKL